MNKLTLCLTLRGRVLLILLTLFVGLSSLEVWDSLQHRDELMHVAWDRLLNNGKLIAARHQSLIGRGDAILNSLTRDSAIFAPANDQHCMRLLNDRLVLEPAFIQAGVVAPNGDVICTAKGGSSNVNAADRDWFQQTLQSQEMVISDVFVGRVLHQRQITLAKAFRNAGGQVRGVIYLSLSIDRLKSELIHAGLPENTRLVVIDGSGELVIRHPDAEGLTGTSFALRPQVKRILAKGGDGVDISDSVNGIAKLVAYTPLMRSTGGRQYYLWLSVPKAEIEAPAQQHLMISMAMVLSILVAVLIFVYWLGQRYLVQPLHILTRTAERMGKGDLGARSGLPWAMGEIGELARALELMATQLQENMVSRQRLQLEIDQHLRVDAERHHFAEGLHQAAIPILLTKPDGYIAYANRAFSDLFGYAIAELQDKHIRFLCPEDTNEMRQQTEIFQQAMSEGMWAGEMSRLHKDGSLIHGAATIATIRDKQQHLLGVVFSFIDLRPIIAKDAALRISEQRYRTILEGAADALMVLGLHGDIEFANRKAAELVGYSQAELLNMNTRELFPAEYMIESIAAFDQLKKDGALCVELRRKCKDGSIKLVEANGIRLPDGNYYCSYRDITALREDALILQHYRDQIELIGRMNADGTVIFVNEAYCRFFGKSASELVGKKWQPTIHQEDVPAVESKLSTLSPEQPMVMVEGRVMATSGEWRWLQFMDRGFFSEDGKLLEIQGVGRDISDIKAIEERLRINKERLKLVLDATRDGVWDWNLRTGKAYLSERYYEMSGYQPGEVTPDFEFFKCTVHPDDLPHVMEVMETHMAGRSSTSEFDYRLVGPTGNFIWVSGRGRIIERSADGVPLRMIGTISDVSERKKAEIELLAAHEALEIRVIERTEQVRSLAIQASLAEERERQAIARDLHDDLGQTLHIARIKLEDLTSLASEQQSQPLADLSKLIFEASRSVRSLTSQLSPPVLRDLGLGAALEWLGEEIERNYGLGVEVNIEDTSEPLIEEQSVILFRVVRELLINVAKHADADMATVAMFSRDQALHLVVEDDGIGFDEYSEAFSGGDGFGLSSVRERIQFLGGTIELSPRTGDGVCVRLKMPLTVSNAEINKDVS